MTAVAYIRRSSGNESQVSEKTQRDTVARLAADRGDTLGRTFRDWGKSGGSKTRPEYREMLAEADAGGVTTIYAYDQDRLARSNLMFAQLLEMADECGFSIITPAGDLTHEDRRDFAEMRGLMDGAELRKIGKRNKATSRMQDDRGDSRGVAPYGYEFRTPKLHGVQKVEHVKVDPDGIEHVIEAYRAAGTFMGAARALNAEGFPAKRGGDWHPVTLRDLIMREAPDLVQGVTQGRRKRNPPPRYFRGLLRCHCGGSMSPGSSGKSTRGHLYYYCGRGSRGAHPGPHVIAESKLTPWVAEEAAQLVLPSEVEMDSGESTDTSAKRARLEAARDLIGEDAYTEALAKLDAEDTAGAERARIIAAVPPTLDWDWSVEAINEWLRAAFEFVELGDDLLPVRAEWLVPEWRKA